MISISRSSTHTRDMTQGSIVRQLLLFAVPLMLGNIFQMLYNTVDSIVVGNFVSKQALAAVGVVKHPAPVVVSENRDAAQGAADPDVRHVVADDAYVGNLRGTPHYALPLGDRVCV